MDSTVIWTTIAVACAHKVFMNEECLTAAFKHFIDAPLGGKSVLLVGEDGPLGVALQCLIERSGMVTLKSQWRSKSLQTQVS